MELDNIAGFLQLLFLVLLFVGYYVYKGFRENSNALSFNNAFNKIGLSISRHVYVPCAASIAILALDKENRQIGLGAIKKNAPKAIALNATNIVSCELIEDKDTLIKTSNTSLVARTLVGAAITGGVGAIIGGITAKKNTNQLVNKVTLRIFTTDLDQPVRDLIFLNQTVKKDSKEYLVAIGTATEWYGVVKAIIS